MPICLAIMCVSYWLQMPLQFWISSLEKEQLFSICADGLLVLYCVCRGGQLYSSGGEYCWRL